MLSVWFVQRVVFAVNGDGCQTREGQNRASVENTNENVEMSTSSDRVSDASGTLFGHRTFGASSRGNLGRDFSASEAKNGDSSKMQ